MDSFTVNKIAGAVLGTCVVGMAIKIGAESIMHPEQPKKPGYALPNPKSEQAANGGQQPGVTPIAVRLAKADPKKGETDAKVCTACHNFAEGAGAKVGPDLYGVVDRPKGKEPGFNYSAGMKAKGGNWTYADLDQFLTKPAAYVQGTLMGYPGQEDPEKRADIIAYLHTLSKNPAPLPKPSPEEAKQASAGGGKQEPTEKASGEAAGEADFLKLVGAADPKKGQADAQVCSACHNFKKGGQALIGPPLWDVVNRKKGSVAGYDYSEGLKKKGGEWTIDDLNAWLTNPAKYIPGTKMGYPGEADAKKRAQIIAFLRTLSDHPVKLPDEKKGAEKAAAPHEGQTKTMVPGAKPSDQKPPAPANPPGSPQPVPKVPEASTAAGAPHKPDERRPNMPNPAPAQDENKASALPGKGADASAAKPSPSQPKPSPSQPEPSSSGSKPAPAKDEAKAAAPAASAPAPASADAAAAGPEPYSAPDPQDPGQAGEPQTLPKPSETAPSLTPGGDKDSAAAEAPEPYAAPDPSDGAAK